MNQNNAALLCMSAFGIYGLSRRLDLIEQEIIERIDKQKGSIDLSTKENYKKDEASVEFSNLKESIMHNKWKFETIGDVMIWLPLGLIFSPVLTSEIGLTSTLTAFVTYYVTKNANQIRQKLGY